MLILRHDRNVPEKARGAVVALGRFDGLHLGHQAVIAEAGRLARAATAPLAVVGFEPGGRPVRLTPFRTKARLIEALGVGCLFVLPVGRSPARLGIDRFLREVLAESLGVRHLVAGGTLALAAQPQSGLGVSRVARVEGPGGEPCSSAQVRAHLEAGEPARAARLLGRCFEIEGRVGHGDKRGRDLGFPTANMDLGEFVRPAFGVYAVRAAVERGAGALWHDGVANLGVRPMFKVAAPLLEPHLFDFDRKLYGRRLRVALVEYLRPEMSFDGIEPLKAKMAEDAEQARAILAKLKPWPGAWPGG